MKYYLGNFQRRSAGGLTFFAPPIGAIAGIDLAPLPQQNSSSAERPVGIFWSNAAILPSEYTLVGDGDCRELQPDSLALSAFRSLVGYKPKGVTLADCVLDCLMGGSDPDGNTGPLPIVPDANGWIDLWMPGHSRVLSCCFEWGKPSSRGHDHTPKLKQLLRSQFAQLFADAKGGKLKDGEHHRRVLDAWCDKYNLQGQDDWKELVPQNLQGQVPGRLKHQTTLTDDFNRADGGLGANWTSLTGTWSIASNVAAQSDSLNAFARYDADLSSTDHYSQNDASTSSNVGAACRKDSSATMTQYMGRYAQTGAASELYKQIGGSFTLLTNDTIGQSGTKTIKTEANGSAIKFYVAGSAVLSTTDTSISSGLRCCMYNVTTSLQDNFQGADLAASGTLYTQLERSPRGLMRGMYTRWG